MKKIKVILSLGAALLLFNAPLAQTADDPQKSPCLPCEEIKKSVYQMSSFHNRNSCKNLFHIVKYQEQ